jgi:hypothetical protein
MDWFILCYAQMKNKLMRFLIFLTIVCTLLFSCRKDQRKINRIEGKWTVRWAEVRDFGVVEPDLVFKFDWCKARFDDFCDFSSHDFATGQTNNGVYSISRDGKTLLLNLPGFNTNHFETFTIDRLNFRTLLLTNVNEQTTFYKKLRLRSMD